MSNKETGGDAFPRATKITSPTMVTQIVHTEGGMTLRDYFAAKAMQGALNSPKELHNELVFAKWCYEMADAMLSARSTEKAREQT